MKKIALSGAISTFVFAAAAHADAPSVAVDIPPIHSLVTKVMAGVGAPNLIVQPGASPHGYSLRPSEAAALQDADVVYWVSEGLTPWLKAPIKALAGDAKSVELLEVDGATELEFREGVAFEKHEHDEDDHDEAHHAEDEDEHAHDEHAHDPHAWLDPENAKVWLDVIATDLAGIDPENADTYAANAAAAKSDLNALINEIDVDLAKVRGTNFVVFHDAYQYFENRFHIPAVGAITLGDASAPSPARIAEIRGKVAELGVTCAFTEPQFNPGLLQAVFQDSGTTTGVLDPLGADLPLGSELYPQLLRNLANSLTTCLK